MKQVRMGDVPPEYFTGVGDLRSHDKACNEMTSEDLLKHEPAERISFARQVILFKRAEKKKAKHLKKIGIDYGIKRLGISVSIRDLL